MAAEVTLEQVERLAVQLTPAEQLKLMAHLSDRLSTLVPQASEEERHRQAYFARAEAFLKMCEEDPVEMGGETDVAEDLRQIRDERVERL